MEEMKIEDQMCSFEQARKLKSLGLNIETLWSYEVDTREIVHDASDCILKDLYIPAPTVAELGSLLPKIITVDEIEYFHSGSRMNHAGFFSMAYENDNQYLGTWMEETEAQARAEALIWLIENGYVDPKELKL
jgi:hypothetical protein